MEPIKGQHSRTLALDRSAVNEDARTVEVAISSELPVERWFGLEILDHSTRSIDLSRMKDGAPVLCDHDSRDVVGVVESVSVDSDRRLRGVLRFGRSARAQEVWQDVLDGIRTKISVGYSIDEYTTTKGEAGQPDTIRATRWTPFECSFVSIPADPSVGVGRAHTTPTPAAQPVTTEVPMEPNTPTVAAQAAEPRGLDVNTAMELIDQATRLQCGDQVRDALRQGATEAQARKLMLDAVMARASQAPIQTPAAVPLTDQEAKRYSIARAIMASATGASCFEREISQELSKKLGRETNGILIPTTVAMARVLEASTAATAKNLVSTETVTFIELLRNKTKVLGMGATYLPGLVGNVPFARQNGAGTATWSGDAPGSATANSDPTLETFSLTPKQLMAVRTYSKQLLAQTNGFVDSYVSNDLSAAHALAVDLASLHGSGSSNQPTGLAATSGIGAVAMGTNGLAPDWASVVALETAVATANADEGTMGYLTNAKVRGKMKTTPKVSGQPIYIWGEDNRLNGYRAEVSGQVSSGLTKGSSSGVCSAMFFGNWSELLIGEWGALDVVTDPYSLADKGLIRLVSTQLVDINVRHAASFAAVLDYLTT